MQVLLTDGEEAVRVDGTAVVLRSGHLIILARLFLEVQRCSLRAELQLILMI